MTDSNVSGLAKCELNFPNIGGAGYGSVRIGHPSVRHWNPR